MKQFSKVLILMVMCGVIPLKAQAAGEDGDIEPRGGWVRSLLEYSTIQDRLESLRIHSGEDFPNLISGITEITEAQLTLLSGDQSEPEVSRNAFRLMRANFRGLHILNQELLLRHGSEVARMSAREFREDMRALDCPVSIGEFEHQLFRRAVDHLSSYLAIGSKLTSLLYRAEAPADLIVQSVSTIGQQLHQLQQANESRNEEAVVSSFHQVLAANFRGLRLLQRLADFQSTPPMSDQEFLRVLHSLGILVTLEKLESLL